MLDEHKTNVKLHLTGNISFIFPYIEWQFYPNKQSNKMAAKYENNVYTNQGIADKNKVNMANKLILYVILNNWCLSASTAYL